MSLDLSMLLPEGEDAPIELNEMFSAGLASLRLLSGEAWLNAEDLLRQSVALFTFLKLVGLDGLNVLAYGMISRRWLDLIASHQFMISNPRLAVPAIEAAAAGVPGLPGVARLIEAGQLATSLSLHPELIASLRKAL